MLGYSPLALGEFGNSGPWGTVDLIRRLLHRDRITGQAARFIVVGLINTLVDIGAFYLLSLIPGMPHTLAKGISYVLGICNSFFWNKYWTFGAAKSARGAREFAIFFAVNLPPLVVNIVVFRVLGIWLDSGSTAERMLKALVAAVVSVAWNFLGSRYFAFRHTAVKDKPADTGTPAATGGAPAQGGNDV
jgi:putative flippase GtrA